jgi:hypothetical protein
MGLHGLYLFNDGISSLDYSHGLLLLGYNAMQSVEKPTDVSVVLGLFNELHAAISQKIAIFITTAVRTSNPTLILLASCTGKCILNSISDLKVYWNR